MSKPFLVIFGLRGTLLERLNIQETTSAIPRRPSLTFAKYNAWLRPGCTDLLAKLTEVCDVAIWSATPHRNTAPLVSMAFPSIDFKFVWHREHTSSDNIKRLLSAGDVKNQYSVIKDLERVYQMMPQYCPERTIMVDDTVFKTRNQIGNVVLVPTYDVNCIMREKPDVAEIAPSVDPLLDLIKKLISTNDVRKALPQKLFWRA